MTTDAARRLRALIEAAQEHDIFTMFNYEVIHFPDIAEAYRRYAEALGKSVADLTDAEKQQAVINAVLEQGEE